MTDNAPDKCADDIALAEVPFVVEPEFLMRPGMSRIEVDPDKSMGEQLCEPDSRQLRLRMYVESAVRAGRLPLGQWATPDIAAAVAEAQMLLTGDSGASAESPAQRLMALRLAVPDDLVLLAPGAQATLVAAAVAMPSGWDPAQKLGLDFSQIHRDVPDAPALTQSAARLSQMILRGGPFRRYVWTLADNASWSQHPDDRQSPAHGSVWYRVERQTTVAMPGSGFCLFLIRVYHVPLPDILRVQVARTVTLVRALESMSAAVIRYKNLASIKDMVVKQYSEHRPAT